jgi:hypothetical protein
VVDNAEEEAPNAGNEKPARPGGWGTVSCKYRKKEKGSERERERGAFCSCFSSFASFFSSVRGGDDCLSSFGGTFSVSRSLITFFTSCSVVFSVSFHLPL